MQRGSERFFLVSADILPEAIKKTAEVKEILTKKEAATINEAVEKVGISRSAYYKYKDGVFPIHAAGASKITTISLILEHRSGILSQVINTIAQFQGNILTINQSIPLQGVANVTISLETGNMLQSIEELLQGLKQINGVKKVEIIGNS
ncbi:ACT domain-containing protein [Zhaonella formicivorans]|jgi:chorismate mutase|uniref:ACT domain-containing protein n=1 Tax=Zhaonella formicivorans TaxID=2528593 RepID=UPI0010D6FD30|nr:ACT domain-containing protein [Zhaonella formicivorans]